MELHHGAAVRGFERLAAVRATLSTPVPVLFEVYTWLLHRAGSAAARTALTWMLDELHVVYLSATDLEELATLLQGRSAWTGSLEDAAVALTGIRLDVPV